MSYSWYCELRPVLTVSSMFMLTMTAVSSTTRTDEATSSSIRVMPASSRTRRRADRPAAGLPPLVEPLGPAGASGQNDHDGGTVGVVGR